MTALSIRLRLAIWYGLVLLLALSVLGAGIWLGVDHSLRTALDRTLTDRAQGVITTIAIESADVPPADLTKELNEYARESQEGRLIGVRDESGRYLLKPSFAYPPSLTISEYGTVRTQDGQYRLYRASSSIRGHVYQIFVAGSMQQIAMTERLLRAWLFLAAPLVLVIASLGGYWISRRALAPVDAITHAARSIGIGNLGERLPVPPTGDELQRLSEAWNEMLGRLDDAVRSLSRFTADASHELRTPVALIRTTAELALRRERAADVYREALGQIADEAVRTGELVEDLLALARADAGNSALQFDRVDLAEVCREVCAQAEPIASARELHLTGIVPAGPTWVEGHKLAVHRLLLQLIDNALKYTRPGGSVTLALSAAGDAATVSVRDTGIGIDAAALPHIFERFYRADASRTRETGGSGLGLAIAKWIADSHHAEIQVSSAAGEGSEFQVRFPASLS